MRHSKKSSSARRPRLGQKDRSPRGEANSLLTRLRRYKRRAYGVLGAFLGGGIYLFIAAGGYDRLEAKTIALVENWLYKGGVRLDNIIVEGRHHTTTREVSRALSVQRGGDLLGLDVQLLKDNLGALPWVRSALVQKRFPDTLYIRLRERSPVALWQDGGQTYLIDEQGVPILGASTAAHQKLLTVSGEEAPRYAPQIVDHLKSYPALSKRLQGAVLNGGRQWDLLVGAGTRVKLPEENLEKALTSVNALIETGHLDNPKIRSIDVRLGDRTFFYLDPEEVKKHQVSFQQKNKKQTS